MVGFDSVLCASLKSSEDDPSVGGRIDGVGTGAADLMVLRNFADTKPAPYNDADLFSSLLDVIDSGSAVVAIELP